MSKRKNKGKYGKWKTFEDMIDGLCDKYRPTNYFKYDEFAVYDFPWSGKTDVIKEEIKGCKGVLVSRDMYLIAVIDELAYNRIQDKQTEQDK